MDPAERNTDDRLTRLEPLILFLVLYLPGYLLQSHHFSGKIFNSVAFNLDYLLQALPRIALLAYIIALRVRNSRAPNVFPEGYARFGLASLRSRDLAWAILVLGAIELIVVPLTLFAGLLTGGEATASMSVRWQLDNPAILPLVFLTTMSAGYSEEMFFRSYLLTVLPREGIGTGMSVVASTLLFGLGHLYEGYLAAVATVLIGALLSVVFLWKRNLNMIAIAHGLYNFITLLATLPPNGGPT